MLTTSVLAKEADVPVYTVRHYTRIGLITPLRRHTNGYKVFKDSDISTIRFIRNARSLGFTLKEIGHILDMAKLGLTPCPTVREIVLRRITENRAKIETLRRLQEKMEEAKSAWTKMPDSVPNGDSVCHLIEAFDDKNRY
ncbi:MAG: MerR family transcriptional regulator [Acidobacteria bacterium]|nr:MAG: MerR family transcriptional regulator [Acidobacteriota bacterium]REJ98255.1 MAG: MerR family transcriptional regulator [Acidobacteriota bacterium]REK16999.1 MAG: MerR family transcriptional regulator [Acidobacteriota bacterium]REK42909.1 MAG: MerR family transcriptional regulator [Acidobacteriota bacterium]